MPDLVLNENPYDEANDELLLLKIMGTTSEAVSPNLQAALADQVDFAWPAAQRPQSPLLMERPRSSGIDTSAFSFARPTQTGKPFSFQPVSRRASSGTAPAKPRENEPATIDKGGDGEIDEPRLLKPCRKTTAPPLQSPAPATRPQSVKSPSNPNKIPTQFGQEEHSERQGAVRDGETVPAEPESAPNPQLLSPDVSMQGASSAQSILVGDLTRGTGSFGLTRVRTSPLLNVPTSLCEQTECLSEQVERHGEIPEQAPPFQRPSSRHDVWKVMKRRRSDNRKKRGSHAPLIHANSQISEEALFQQLIDRLRAREESEAVASHLQKEMEADMLRLEQQNKALKEELEILGSKLRQRTTEAKAYRAQTNSWKSKLAKIKVFLNEIGSDYQNLRGDAIHLKAARKSLEKERKDIADDIKDVRARMIEVTQASLDKRVCISESEGIIATLREELKHARERAQYSEDQLADEKKRSRLLEIYIQNCSRSQDRKLDLVKTNQLELANRIESAFEAMSKNHELSHAVTSNAHEQRLNELTDLLKSTTEIVSIDKIDVQQCREFICSFESRMDSQTRQLAEDIESHNGIAEKLMTILEEQVEGIKDSVGGGSALLKQLSTSETGCSHLRAKLETAVPVFEKLDSSIDGLRNMEANLGERMKSLETRLSEVKLPGQFEDNYFHISEKLSLEVEIQKLTLTMKSAEEKRQVEQLDRAHKHDELRQMTTQKHQLEVNAAKLESHIASLQERLNTTEKEARESIDKAVSSARQECRLEYEQRLHGLLLEKIEVEAGLQRAQEQLTEAQQKLAEVETSARNQRNDLEASLTGRQELIHDLEASNTEHTFRIEKQEAEIQELKERELALIAQQNSLQSQLNEAHRKSESFSEGLLKTMTENQLSLGALQSSFSTLQENLAKKEQDCQALQGSLTFLQEKLVKKEGECQSLQCRLTVTQSELARNESERQNLQSNVSSLQVGISQHEEANRALRDSLSSLQSDLSDKEKNFHSLQASEYLALSKQLEDAIVVRQTLEAGKSKAQAQVLPLFKRVQASESGLKQVRELLQRMNIAQIEQPLFEALGHLERNLQTPCADIPAISGQAMPREELPEASQETRYKAEISEGSQSAVSAYEPKTPVIHLAKPSQTDHARNIVPFSDILKELSPDHCVTSENEPFDLSGILTQTPDKILSTQDLSVPARPEKGNPFMDVDSDSAVKAQETPLQHVAGVQMEYLCMQEKTRLSSPAHQSQAQSKEPLPGRKVSFVTQESIAKLDNFQVADSQEKDEGNFLESSANNDHPARNNRWTYSKRQRETVTKQQDTVSTGPVEDQQMRSKKVKTSSSSSVVTQTRTASELFERRKSPTRLASGSSRTPSANVAIPGHALAQSTRRSQRKRRGDKYNARFSQGA
ncbi:hypothetical protein BJY04DRAFT_231828 [Aspergillus karnatakaensis]|uniref:uncharacterized protein n=1 Tax=Aspergillus karnatakaensis TaxID=1810916 RepID=UPI003CCCB8BB